MTVTNSNLNVSQLSLQSLREENFSEVPFNEPVKVSPINNNIVKDNGNLKFSARRVPSNPHLPSATASKSSSSIVGLGIRRQSDSSKKDCPFSNYSTRSNSSDTSSQDEFTSRVSSLTSYTTSPFMSPVIPDLKKESVTDLKKQTPVKQTTPRANSVGHPRFNSSPLLHTDLTPQQRYRLRRSQSKSTLKDIEQRYEDYESDDEIADDTFVWNVPLAVGGAASFFANDKHCQSPTLVNKVLKGSSQHMPPTQLPGLLHNARSAPNLPISPVLRKQTSFAHLSPLARDISSYYTSSTSDFFRKELQERKSFSESLPLDVLDAQIHGFDDFKLISKEKLSSFTSTRPVWLPPKSSEEIKKHKRQIQDVLSAATKLELNKKEKLVKKLDLDKLNEQRYQVINNKSSIKLKHVKECGLMLFDTKMPRDIEYDLLTKLSLKLHQNFNIEDINKEYELLCVKCESIDFTTKTREFEDITNKISLKYKIFQDETGDEFKRLLALVQLNQLSEFELFPYLTSKLILDGYSNKRIYILMKFYHANLNNEQFLSKYYSNIQSNIILKKKLSHNFYKDELDNLSLKLFLSVLPELIMLRFFKIVLCICDYKILYALLLTVLRDYHFGYNSVKDLVIEGKELDFENVIDEDKFFEKLKFYYKKF